jgi:hypothetical protein
MRGIRPERVLRPGLDEDPVCGMTVGGRANRRDIIMMAVKPMLACSRGQVRPAVRSSYEG